MFRFFIALYAAKTIRIFIKIFGRILKLNGSHFPGNVALKICPKFLEKVGKPKTIITVTGTNGKTTTCNLLTDCLEKNGYKVLNNSFGSNVRGGITTALFNGVNIFNHSKYDIGVLEVDERSSMYIYPYVKPTYAVITNLFRDSLKRNAHSEYIFDIINKAIPDSSTLILNADDLISNRMKDGINKRIYFGIDKLDTDAKESVNIVNDARICPNCYAKLEYEYIRYHHIGKAYCPICSYKSPEANYSVEKVDYDNKKIIVRHGEEKETYKMINEGVHNIYNEIATIAVLKEVGLTSDEIQNAFEQIHITRARYDERNINGLKLINYLAKGQNPVACSIVFKSLKEDKNKKELVLLIEDYHDNRESSENIAWFYDCDFEFLNSENIEKIIAGGKRAEDLKFRLLLAGIPEEKIVALRDESKIPDYLSYKKGTDIYILYDMYEQTIVDSVNKLIEEKISGGVEND